MATNKKPAINNMIKASEVVADAASWICALALISMLLVAGIKESALRSNSSSLETPVKGGHFSNKPCDEIYVVGEGETLHTISVKCGDPFIVEQNPHIHDPDDVFPGLVIRITPFPES